MSSDRLLRFFKLLALTSRMRMIVFAYFLLVVQVCSARTSYAVEDYEEGAKRTIEAMLAARAELHSGIFRAVGKDTNVSEDLERKYELPSELCCVFDKPGERLRFERRGQTQVDLRPSSQLKPEVVEQIRLKTFTPNLRIVDLVAMYVRSPEYMAGWDAVGQKGDEYSARSNVDLKKSDAKPNVRRLQPFHYSAVGLFTPQEYSDGYTADEIVEDALGRASTVELQKQADEMLHVVFSNDRMRQTFEIDPTKGFTVQRMKLIGLDESGQPTYSERYECSASWEQIDGVWVPVQFSTESHYDNGNGRKHVYDIKWEAVNPEKLDDELFTYQSFKGVWDNVYVFDRRGGKPVHIDTFGRPFEPNGLPKPTGEAGLAKGSPGNADGGSTKRFWLLFVNGIAIVAVLIFFGWRRFRRANSSG